MEPISMENLAPTPEEPRRLQRTGPRTGQEVFQELRQRLDSQGYLPDEYFELDSAWDNDRTIPEDADLFCTTDYGESEGIYTDVYLKWYENGKAITESFATGKTLGETGADLDRMFLIASAITKAFHGDGASHARSVQMGGASESEGAVVHLSGEERRILLDALVERRNQLVEDTVGVEKVLRRMTGNITEYVNEVGHRPLRISDYDRAALAVQDGNLEEFRAAFSRTPEQTGPLLVQAAGRSGMVGRQMCRLLLDGAKDLPGDIYLTACKATVDTADLERVKELVGHAAQCVADLDPAFYGEVICHAYAESKQSISSALIQQCTPEQIAAAKPTVLYFAAMKGDFRTASALVEKGIDATEYAGDILHTLYAQNNGWMAERLLEQGMRINNVDLNALHACVKNGGLKSGQLLLDRGMDFAAYQAWAQRRGLSTEGHDDTLQALAEHWKQRQDAPAQSDAPEAEGMTLGPMGS